MVRLGLTATGASLDQLVLSLVYAVICEDCDCLGREADGDPGEWVRDADVGGELPAAA
jgi:hypothetical protein